jgi:hypothetical protein
VKQFWVIFIALHKRIDIYYAELIALSTGLQAGWSDLQFYVPDTMRHWIIGSATAIVAVNHIIEAVRRAAAPPPPP